MTKFHLHRFSYVLGIVNNTSTQGLTVILPNTSAELSTIETNFLQLKKLKLESNSLKVFCPEYQIFIVKVNRYESTVNELCSYLFNAFILSFIRGSDLGVPVISVDEKAVQVSPKVNDALAAKKALVMVQNEHGKNGFISFNKTGNTAPNFNMLSDLMSAMVWKLDYNDINGSLSVIYNTFSGVISVSVLSKSDTITWRGLVRFNTQLI
uniref:Uncharacterized protein n=1 Tax=Glossina palpalis gambiensis TaxID=67801 RepID=A0A1B0BZJ4_9MUSC